ncbi:MAG: DUF3108 domain-containing protein [bacterium]|nr:DUF3108 domain-containing protein [bacterium]
MIFLPLLICCELLNYNIYFGSIRAGRGTLRYEKNFTSIDGVNLSRATLVVQSEGIINSLFPVYDSIVSIFHSDSFFTYSYEKKISEGKYRDRSKAIYSGDTVYYDDGSKFAISGGTFDPISLIFFLREKENLDSTLVLNYHVDKRSFKVNIRPKRIFVKGKELIKIYLDLRDPKLSKTPGELIYLFEADGERRPLELQFKTSFGVLKARLK